MDGSRSKVDSQLLERIPPLTKAEGRSASLQQQLKSSWAAAIGLGWPLAWMIATALEPAPAHPDEHIPVVVMVASYALFAGLLTSVWAAMARLRIAAVAGVVTGAMSLGLTLACPLSGHHNFGAWWYGQLAVVGAMLAVSAAALTRRARATDPV